MMIDWSFATGGITESMPRTTGLECINYLPKQRIIFEIITVTLFCFLIMLWAIKNLEPIIYINSYKLNYLAPSKFKQILLITMTFVFGMEVGFKLATKTMIFIFNPCHITTIIQIYLLAARPSKTVTALFRIHMNYLNGPLLAFMFPDAESRHLPFECATYYIQHGLMVIIPIYLLRHGGAYNMERFFDFKWNLIGYTTMIIYHFTVLQGLSWISKVNLDYMLCPSLSDPFEGPNYRLAAVLHQAILCPVLCKLCTITLSKTNHVQLDVKVIKNHNETFYNDNDLYDSYDETISHLLPSSSITSKTTGFIVPSSSGVVNAAVTPGSTSTSTIIPPVTISRIEDPIMTTKID